MLLIRQNKTECKFSREYSSSKPQTIQKQTNHLAAASSVLPERCVLEKMYRQCIVVYRKVVTSFWKHPTGSSYVIHVSLAHVRPEAHILMEAPNRQQLSDLLVSVLFVTLKKRIPSKICILSCFV